MNGQTSKVVKLKAFGPDDPNGERAASVLSAYFNVEVARTFRQALWPRLALCAAAAWLIEATTSLLPRAGLLIVLLGCGMAAVAVAIAELRAYRALAAELGRCPTAIARTVDETF